MQVEPLLRSNNQRFTLFPITQQKAWELYKQREGTLWVAEELDLREDVNDWDNTLNITQKNFVQDLIAYFACYGWKTNSKFITEFSSEIELPEIRSYYGFQQAVENIHMEVYSILADTFVTGGFERSLLLLTKKEEWTLRQFRNAFGNRLVAFAITESIFFCSLFCAAKRISRSNIMQGLSRGINLVAKDKRASLTFSMHMYSGVANKLSPFDICKMIQEAVEIELEFASILFVGRISLDHVQLTQHIKAQGDLLMVAFNCDKFYREQNPFAWCELPPIECVTEERKKAPAPIKEVEKFSLDEDF